MNDRQSVAEKLKIIRDNGVSEELDQKEIEIRYTQFRERLTTEELRRLEMNYQRQKTEQKKQDHHSKQLKTYLKVL